MRKLIFGCLIAAMGCGSDLPSETGGEREALAHLDAEYYEGIGIQLVGDSEDEVTALYGWFDQFDQPAFEINGEVQPFYTSTHNRELDIHTGDQIRIFDLNNPERGFINLDMTRLSPMDHKRSANFNWLSGLNADDEVGYHCGHSCTSSWCNSSGYRVRIHYHFGKRGTCTGGVSYTCNCY